MLLTGAFSEVLPQSEMLMVSHLGMGDRDLFFSLKVSNLGNVFHLFLHVHLYKHLLRSHSSLSPRLVQGLFFCDTSREEIGATCSYTSIGEIFHCCCFVQE